MKQILLIIIIMTCILSCETKKENKETIKNIDNSQIETEEIVLTYFQSKKNPHKYFMLGSNAYLTLNNPSIAEIKMLKGLKGKIKVITISGDNFKDEHVKYLHNIDSISALRIQSKKFTGKNLFLLREKTITGLHIEACDIDIAGFKQALSIKSLEELNVGHNKRIGKDIIPVLLAEKRENSLNVIAVNTKITKADAEKFNKERKDNKITLHGGGDIVAHPNAKP